MRNAFAQAAVAELATAYSAVLSDARRDGRADAARWIAATEAYIENLTTIARAADAGAEIRFLFGPEGPLRIIVGSDPVRQFMLAAPRPHESGRLEQAVLKRFCQAAGCLNLRADGPGAEPRTNLETRVSLNAKRGGDGLSCALQGLRHGKLYRRACAQLIGELRALVAVLIGIADPIDWSEFGPPRRRGPSHLVPVDRLGNGVVADVPALYRSPQVLTDAIPWLQERLVGKVASFRLIPPASLVYGSQVVSR